MTKYSGIYTIKNIVDNKQYIGSSNHLDKRWKDHKSLLMKNKKQRLGHKFSEETKRKMSIARLLYLENRNETN